MSQRRSIPKPIFYLSCWRQVGRFQYKADPQALSNELEKTEASLKLQRHRMGRGFRLIEKALAEETLTQHEVQIIEHGLSRLTDHDADFL